MYPDKTPISTLNNSILGALQFVEEAAVHFGREVVGALEGNDATAQVRPEVNAIT